jgi:hypothetical protein
MGKKGRESAPHPGDQKRPGSRSKHTPGPCKADQEANHPVQQGIMTP